MEIPGLNALAEQFEATGTQVLGISVDSKYCHTAWANGLTPKEAWTIGISLILLVFACLSGAD